MKRIAITLLALIWCPQAVGREIVAAEGWSLDVAGDIKSFTFSAFPYEWSLVPDEELEAFGMEPMPLMPEDPMAQGALDGRLKAELELGDHVSVSAHARSAASYYSQALEAGAISLGSGGGGYDQVVDMAWEPVDAPNYMVEGRVDRLAAKISVPHLDVTIGRQPISFGSSWIFTPMDLVAPFSPTDIDTEYKPGIDAARVDAFFGMAGQITAVAAYAGDWSPEGTVLAMHAANTFGITDVGLFAAYNRAEPVFGLDMASSIGPVGLHGEGTVTLPPEDTGEDPFLRAAFGANWMPLEDLSIMAELYWQSVGGADSGEYLGVYGSERFARGELWAAGRYYAALTAGYQLTPLVGVSAFSVVNLSDPSAMIGPSLSWSVAENAELAMGAFFGAGERPHDVALTMDDVAGVTTEDEYEAVLEEIMLERTDVGSEFGMIPSVGYAQIKLYF
jgi:hypothetical protein